MPSSRSLTPRRNLAAIERKVQYQYPAARGHLLILTPYRPFTSDSVGMQVRVRLGLRHYHLWTAC